MSVREMTTRQVRDRLASVVDAARSGEATVVTHRGKRVAAVVPVGVLDEYDRLAEEADLAVIRDRLARVEAGEPTIPLTEVIAETLDRAE